MGLLHQPELEPGPHRELVDALHRLHHEAGRPSVRAIGRRAGCSHTTVFHLFTHPRLPAWSLVEVVVPATRLEARKGRSAAAASAGAVVVLEAVVGRVRTTRRAAPTPVVVVVAVVVATADRVEVDAEVVARGLMASFRAALPLSSLPAMVERVRLALVRSPSAALFRVPRTPEAAEAADALVAAVTVEAGLEGPASAAPPSRP